MMGEVLNNNDYKIDNTTMAQFILDTTSPSSVPSNRMAQMCCGCNAVAILHKTLNTEFNKRFGGKTVENRQDTAFKSLLYMMKHCERLEKKFFRAANDDVGISRIIDDYEDMEEEVKGDADRIYAYQTSSKLMNDVLQLCVETVSMLYVSMQYCPYSALADIAGCGEIMQGVSKTIFLYLLLYTSKLPTEIEEQYRKKGEENFRIVNTITGKTYNEILRRYINNGEINESGESEENNG